MKRGLDFGKQNGKDNDKQDLYLVAKTIQIMLDFRDQTQNKVLQKSKQFN